MARRQRRFCTSKAALICCPSTHEQASTSGRDMDDMCFNMVGCGPTGKQTRSLPFASTAVKVKMTTESLPPKTASSGGDKPLHDVLAGALARAISQGTIHPIDTLKVRMQAASTVVASAGAAAPASAAAQPGLDRLGGALRGALTEAKSLYRGVLGAAGGAGIIIGAFFAFYSTAKRLLRERTNLSEGTVAFIAGAVAAVGSSVVKVPIAVCIRSVQAGVYPNALVAANSVVAKAGPGGLFTGFLPTLLEDVPDMAVKFAVYETLRAVHMRLHAQERPSTLEDLMMGGVAGSAAAAATTPLDVVKTRMMCSASERPTVLQATRGIMAERAGLGSFFRGVGPRALSNGLNSAIFYMWFELLRQQLRDMLAERERQRQLAAGQVMPVMIVGPGATGAQGQRRPPGASSSSSGSGPGHQAVASCTLRLQAGRRTELVAEPGTSSCQASTCGEVTGCEGVAGCAAGEAPAVDSDKNVEQDVAAAVRGARPTKTQSSSGRLGCLSLAVPLLHVSAGLRFSASG